MDLLYTRFLAIVESLEYATTINGEVMLATDRLIAVLNALGFE